MKKKILISVLVIIVVMVVLDLFYFRFHTYLQRTEINEELPAAISPTPVNGVIPSVNPTMRIIAEGQFGEIDLVHKGSGTARIIEQDGKRYLRFENFEVTNGPDLYVYLSNSSVPTHDVNSLGQYANLGRLKGNVGNQNYEIPEAYYGYNTAVIWCKKFSVLFSYAVMK